MCRLSRPPLLRKCPAPKAEIGGLVDDNLGYLFAAFAVTWLAIGAYLLYKGQQVRALRDEVRAISDDDRA